MVEIIKPNETKRRLTFTSSIGGRGCEHLRPRAALKPLKPLELTKPLTLGTELGAGSNGGSGASFRSRRCRYAVFETFIIVRVRERDHEFHLTLKMPETYLVWYLWTFPRWPACWSSPPDRTDS